MTAIIAVKPGDSFEHWHEVTCRQFSQTECSQIARHQFQARVTLNSFGGLGLSSIWSATPQGRPYASTDGRPIFVKISATASCCGSCWMAIFS